MTAERVVLLLVVWGLCACWCCIGLALFSIEGRPDLYGLVIWPTLAAAVISTPFALFA